MGDRPLVTSGNGKTRIKGEDGEEKRRTFHYSSPQCLSVIRIRVAC